LVASSNVVARDQREVDCHGSKACDPLKTAGSLQKVRLPNVVLPTSLLSELQNEQMSRAKLSLAEHHSDDNAVSRGEQS